MMRSRRSIEALSDIDLSLADKPIAVVSSRNGQSSKHKPESAPGYADNWPKLALSIAQPNRLHLGAAM
jgi:hypothetical protein